MSCFMCTKRRTLQTKQVLCRTANMPKNRHEDKPQTRYDINARSGVCYIKNQIPDFQYMKHKYVLTTTESKILI
jgi:hypothetical protein